MNKLLKNLFWDSGLENLDYEKNAPTIIERALELGNPQQLKVIFQHYDREKVVNILRTSRRFTPKTANFWADYFVLPKKDITCLNKQSNQTLKNSWPY